MVVGRVFLRDGVEVSAEEETAALLVAVVRAVAALVVAADSDSTTKLGASGSGGRLAFTMEANDLAPHADIRQ